MTLLVAWRIISHDRARSALAVAGMAIAILLVFVQLGFYNSVPKGGVLVYDSMRFDILLGSKNYLFQAGSQVFPRRRLYQAAELPEVERVAPVYQDITRWLNVEDRKLLGEVFVIGFDPAKPIFSTPDIAGREQLLTHPDTLLVDAGTKPMYGPLSPGRVIELGGRRMTIGGSYTLGPGFLGLAVVVVSDLNFLRIFPRHGPGEVNLGLVTLKPGADPAAVARKLRAILPHDTQVFTRRELYNREADHWMMSTSAGLVFGIGVIVAMIVGTVILYQTLASQVSRNLPQYATLKAIGYSDRQLEAIVLVLGIAMALIGFVPALGGALVIYDVVRQTTPLPAEMPFDRVAWVLMLTVGMATASSLLSVRRLKSADPAEMFR